jgi:hypothetical protein
LDFGDGKNGRMRLRLLFFAGATFAVLSPLKAGTLELQPKETAPPTITQSEPWQFTIAAPGWLASMNGTIGVRGVNADIDIPVTEVLQHLDMIFAMRAEARKGPFGIFGEIIYIGLSDNAQVRGLINNVHEQVDLTLVDGALSWRLINQPRGSLEFAAGTHYTTVYERLTLNGDVVAIHQASEQFVTNISDDLVARLNNDISNSQFVATLKSTIQGDIVNQIDKHNSLDRHQRHPNIPIGPLGGRIHEDVARVVEDLIRLKESALRARIDALHLKGAARRAAVRRMVSAAEAQIADHVAVTLDTKLHQSISRQDDWFDPYVGLRGRYNFNKTYYTAVRGEIGGFGVGADLMWEVEGVLGINLTRSIFTELGYRALGGNFEENNFKFDVVMHGPQITTGITF